MDPQSNIIQNHITLSKFSEEFGISTKGLTIILRANKDVFLP